MVAVTTHAKKRLKERCGINKNSAECMAERAFTKGISFENASDTIKKYISSVFLKNDKTCNNIRIYGNIVYIFDNRTLITVYPLPQIIHNEIEEFATCIDDAADKTYEEYIAGKNVSARCKKPLNQNDALCIARNLFSNESHLPYKYSMKHDHIGKYILLSFPSPTIAKKYNHIVDKISVKTGYRVKVNEHSNTAMLQTEFMKLFLRNNIEIVKPASFISDTVATIYIDRYTPICETLKKQIFDTYGVIVNFSC